MNVPRAGRTAVPVDARRGIDPLHGIATGAGEYGRAVHGPPYIAR